MYKSELPSRVRVLIIGGGIHGVGVLHDMISRGWRDVHLVEKFRIGHATSSRSTKLVHGGLRYLRNIRDFPLVSEALHERKVLMNVAPDLVKPLELILPQPKSGGLPAPILRTGLKLYDLLAGSSRINPYRSLNNKEVLEKAPILNMKEMRNVFSFWDAQTDDLNLVRRVAASAVHLGGHITEEATVVGISANSDGWTVDLDINGKRSQISALYVLNAAGPWANLVLESCGIKPLYEGVNSEGIHIVLPEVGLKVGMFLQDATDKRIFFVLPWMGRTLVGTTENSYEGSPDEIVIRHEPIEYLLQQCNKYLNINWKESDIESAFCGLRWLALERGRDLSTTSRADIVSEHKNVRGLLLTIYGGKLTTYRSLSRSIGDRITKHFGDTSLSKTHLPEMWVDRAKFLEKNELADLTRFLPGGICYSPREKKV